MFDPIYSEKSTRNYPCPTRPLPPCPTSPYARYGSATGSNGPTALTGPRSTAYAQLDSRFSK